jgi:hypothetical protein
MNNADRNLSTKSSRKMKSTKSNALQAEPGGSGEMTTLQVRPGESSSASSSDSSDMVIGPGYSQCKRKSRTMGVAKS